MTTEEDRLIKILEDDSSKGIFIIDKIDFETFTKFRTLSRSQFNNNDGDTLDALIKHFEEELKS